MLKMFTMKKAKHKIRLLVTTPIILIFILFNSCWGPYIDGSGNVIEKSHEVSDFNEIEISGAFKVFVSVGNNESLKIIADDNLHEYIETRVIGDRLVIKTTINIRRAKKRQIYIELKSLDEIDISGAIDLITKSTIKSERFKITASGAVDLDLNLNAEKIVADLSGASDIYLKGKTDKIIIEASGGVEIEAFELESRHFDLTISGAGYAAVYAEEKLDVTISGAAKVRYKGDPEISKNISGAASLKKY